MQKLFLSQLCRAGMPLVSFALLSITTSFLAPGQAQSGEMAVSGPLDGQVFVGKIGDPGEPGRDDRLHFDDGKFWSAICIRCGFQPGDYWVRSIPGGIQFRGEMHGDRGTFVYVGTVRNGTLEATINWSKERWYWSLRRELVFSGQSQDSDIELSAMGALEVAVAAGADLPADCRW